MAVLRVVKHERNRRFAIRTATAEEGREMQAAAANYWHWGRAAGSPASTWGKWRARLGVVS